MSKFVYWFKIHEKVANAFTGIIAMITVCTMMFGMLLGVNVLILGILIFGVCVIVLDAFMNIIGG